MTPKAAPTAVIEIGPGAVRILVGRVQGPNASGVRRQARGTGRSRATASPVKHLDSRTRHLDGDAVTAAVPVADEALAAVVRYLRLAERSGAAVSLVAPAELARSPEGTAILARIGAEIPDPVRLLSPRRRMTLVFDAVRPVLDPESVDLVVMLDGSETQLVFVASGEVSDSCVLPTGPGAIAGALPDPPTPLEWALEAMRLGEMLASALPQNGPTVRRLPARVLVVGQGAEALGGFDAVRGDNDAVALTLADLDRLSDEVVRASSRKIARRTGEDPHRVALLAPAALLLASILSRYGLSRCTLLPQGLRDGVLLAVAADPEAWWRDKSPDASASFDGVASGG